MTDLNNQLQAVAEVSDHFSGESFPLTSIVILEFNADYFR